MPSGEWSCQPGIFRAISTCMTSKFAQYLENASYACHQHIQAVSSQRRCRSLTILPIPPLPEQRAIAAVLDAIDEVIERTEAVIAATERLRDSLLHELLTRGVPGWHSEWKEVPGIGTVPACWEMVRLGDVAEVERGKFAYRPRNDPRFYGGAIPFIQTGDVVQANGKLKKHSQTLNEQGLSISRLFPAERSSSPLLPTSAKLPLRTTQSLFRTAS